MAGPGTADAQRASAPIIFQEGEEMKKMKKTYAVTHLTEKHTVFWLGKTKVHVSFTGGIVTKKGVTPATYTTDDPIVQLAIENSPDFKRGAIKLWSQYPVKGEVTIGKNKPRPIEVARPYETYEAVETCEAMNAEEESIPHVEISEAEAIAEFAAQKAMNFPGAGAVEPIEKVAEPIEKVAEPAEEVSMPQETEAVEEKEPELDIVEASCKDVAKQYLQDHYGENPTPLRTRADIQACAAKHGITFKFT